MRTPLAVVSFKIEMESKNETVESFYENTLLALESKRDPCRILVDKS